MGMKEEHAEVGNDVRRNDGCRKEVEKNGERVGGREVELEVWSEALKEGGK